MGVGVYLLCCNMATTFEILATEGTERLSNFFFFHSKTCIISHALANSVHEVFFFFSTTVEL